MHSPLVQLPHRQHSDHRCRGSEAKSDCASHRTNSSVKRVRHVSSQFASITVTGSCMCPSMHHALLTSSIGACEDGACKVGSNGRRPLPRLCARTAANLRGGIRIAALMMRALFKNAKHEAALRHLSEEQERLFRARHSLLRSVDSLLL